MSSPNKAKLTPAPVTETALMLPTIPESQSKDIVGFQNLSDIRAPYLSFPMKMSGKWMEYKDEIKDLKEYEPLIVTPGPLGDKIIQVSDKVGGLLNFNCVYLHGYQCFSDMNIETGAIISSCIDPTIPNKENKLVEHCEAILLVLSVDRKTLYPCRGSFKKAMSNAVKSMEKVVKLSVTDEWFKESEAHAKTATTQPPNYRFVTKVSIYEQPVRDNPQHKYPTCRCKYDPTTPAFLKLIAEQYQDHNFKMDLQNVIRAYHYRHAEVMSKRIDLVKDVK